MKKWLICLIGLIIVPALAFAFTVNLNCPDSVVAGTDVDCVFDLNRNDETVNAFQFKVSVPSGFIAREPLLTSSGTVLQLDALNQNALFFSLSNINGVIGTLHLTAGTISGSISLTDKAPDFTSNAETITVTTSTSTCNQGTDTSPDCGANCANRCELNKKCLINDDCLSNNCRYKNHGLGDEYMTCEQIVCQNGWVEGLNEECDDGNAANGDGCSVVCTVDREYTCTGSPSVCKKNDGRSCTSNSECVSNRCDTSVCRPVNCGNNVVNNNEGCDDNNAINGDGCSKICEQEEGYTCTGSPSVCLKNSGLSCSNGNECVSGYCDDGTCETSCGNGRINGNDECDFLDDEFVDFDSKTCASVKGQGYTGALGCSDSCKLITTNCQKCGDNYVSGIERCDNTDFGGKTCASVNPATPLGTLSCNDDCTFNTESCITEETPEQPTTCSDECTSPEVCYNSECITPEKSEFLAGAEWLYDEKPAGGSQLSWLSRIADFFRSLLD